MYLNPDSVLKEAFPRVSDSVNEGVIDCPPQEGGTYWKFECSSAVALKLQDSSCTTHRQTPLCVHNLYRRQCNRSPAGTGRQLYPPR